MEKQHNIVYKRTCLINNKIYIGVHCTDDLNDGYMGSGLYFKRALEKYGKENFKSEILYDVETAELAFFIEELLVDEDFIKRDDNYNLRGGGGRGIIGPDSKIKMSLAKHGIYDGEKNPMYGKRFYGKDNPNFGNKWTEDKKRALSNKIIGKYSGENNPMYGKQHSEETKRKQSEVKKGKKQSLETINKRAMKITISKNFTYFYTLMSITNLQEENQ